jgi:hypothetical protein
LKKIKRVLQLKKLKTIEQYRKLIHHSDTTSTSGVSNQFADSLHIYGNTAKTHIDVYHRSIIKPIESCPDSQNGLNFTNTLSD